MTAYVLHLAILAGIYIILTVSINLIIGYAGQVSLGHAAFYGIGAYASALVSLNWHLPFPAAALAGLAGSLYAHYITFINPETFGLHTSILILAMVVLGGMGSIAGSVLGAVILTILPEMLRQAHAYQELIYGGLLMLLLIWRPEGLLGRGKLSLKFLKRES